MKKHMIWSNVDVACDEKETMAVMQECGLLRPNEIPTSERMEEFCIRENEQRLYDERSNLNIVVPSDIVAIADMGLWNGRRSGYQRMGDNVRNCLSSDCDACTWFVDEHGNLRAELGHHDGTNYVLYRVYKLGLKNEQKAYFENLVYEGKATDGDIARYTSRLGDFIGNVYGWKFAGRKPKISA